MYKAEQVDEPSIKFSILDCFENVENWNGYNELFCVNNAMILLAAIINLALISYLTFLHFKVGRQ